jgi:hypothetical protein
MESCVRAAFSFSANSLGESLPSHVRYVLRLSKTPGTPVTVPLLPAVRFVC